MWNLLYEVPVYGQRRDKLTPLSSCDAVAQSVERPSKGPVWCNSTMGLNLATAYGGRKILAVPSVADRDKSAVWEIRKATADL